MKILLLNTYPHGGAGTACRRLQQALNRNGVQAQWLTSDQVGNKWPFYAERLSFLPYEKDKSVRFSFSLANFGQNISRHPLVQQADILHLHWINQGFLSLHNIRQLADLGKPIVWTLHDMWAFTGGCHYSGTCKGYLTGCGNCPYLRWPGMNDLSAKNVRKKQNTYGTNIQFVTCSAWLRDTAASSALLKEMAVQAIPNPIDTDIFQPSRPAEIDAFRRSHQVPEDAYVLLFSAMKVSEARKGFIYLQESLLTLKSRHPDLPIHIFVMGASDPESLKTLPYPVHALGMVSGDTRLAQVYASADVFVIPSLEDNLPNTVMESLACGTPVVGFDTGGIPEMVQHLKEGYIATQKDASDLASGIEWVLTQKEASVLRKAAREKTMRQYSETVVAEQYKLLYNNIL
jgi:glycosyltransferase involved in cell wall biosynthesis